MALGVPKTKRETLKSYEIKPHFFTIIVSPSQLLKLRLPKKFLKNHGKNLSNVAYLRVPNGIDWLVEATNCKGYVWLCKGWKQFAEYYSLAIGYLLVFRYDGNSRFRVLILDTTTLEIDYSIHNLHHSGKFQDPKEDSTSHQSGPIIPEAVSERLLKKANAFVKGCPGFIIRMSKSHAVGRKSSVHVPSCHSKKYMKDEGDDGNVIVIYGKDERSWKMKYRIEDSYPKLWLPCWRKFRSDNGLAIGDVCAFKLISRAQKAYKVAIFRVKGISGHEIT